MSLNINTDLVAEVLLADGWHRVANQSFDLDAYEFIEGHGEEPRTIFAGGKSAHVASTGFHFREEMGGPVVGPITSILALRMDV